jgi:ketosteroid isomerase-like protein
MAQTTDVARLSDFVRFLETGEVAPDAFAADVFFDMNVPSWRYQIQGHEAAARLFHSDEPARMHVGRVAQTADGFVVETDYETSEHGAAVYHRSVSLVTVHDGLITEVVHYCTGPWDEATRVRQAVEAPMLRADA